MASCQSRRLLAACRQTSWEYDSENLSWEVEKAIIADNVCFACPRPIIESDTCPKLFEWLVARAYSVPRLLCPCKEKHPMCTRRSECHTTSPKRLQRAEGG